LEGDKIELADLRSGDTVDITRAKSADAKPISIIARRPADPQRWAIIIANQHYDDSQLTPLEYPLADAQLLSDALVKRYRVPADQSLVFADESLVLLKQSLPNRLERLAPESKLIVCLLGHAYRDDKGAVYFAPKDFNLHQMSANGLPLQWLVDQLEICPAKEKLLLVDCAHAGKGADLQKEPAAADMLRSLAAPAGRAALRTLTAIAGEKSGQRGLDWPDKGHGFFAYHVASGIAGAADKNRDLLIEPTELFEYLQNQMATAGQVSGEQTPELFLPDARPPRLSDDAKKAIRKLAAFLRQEKPAIGEIEPQYQTALLSAGKEIEPKLIFGLILMKMKQNKPREDALKQFEEIQIEYPKLILPKQAIAWLRFERLTYDNGVAELVDMVSLVPKPAKPGDELEEEAKLLFTWSGQLREFAAEGVVENRRASAKSLSLLDASIAAAGPEAKKYYEQGRAKTKSVLADFDQKIAAATEEAERSRLKIERRQLPHYADFPFDRAIRDIIAGMNRQEEK
jgi:hypothetical protein